MGIIFTVAIHTSTFCQVKLVALMASLAACNSVHTLKRELCQFMVKTGCTLPAAGCVAEATISQAGRTVNIIGCVTDMATGIQFFLQRAPMTLHAGELFVSTAQWPTRLLAVIKARSAPVGGVVAIFALLAVAPPMHIAAAMAGDTLGFQLPVSDIFKVTGLAGQVLVSSGQPEAGFDGVLKSPALPVSL